MLKTKITDVFFDLDHTLWDFEKNSALTFQKIFLEHDLEIPLDDFLKIYVPLNHRFWKLYSEDKITAVALRYQRLKKTFDGLGKTVDDTTINSLSQAYIANLSNFGHVLPGATEVLEYLKPKYRLHIITNGFHEIQAKKLKNSGLSDYFLNVIDSEMAGAKKPNPKIFELALLKANAKAENTVMIGDNLEADILGSMALGMQAIHLAGHLSQPHDYCPVFSKLHEIKKYL